MGVLWHAYIIWVGMHHACRQLVSRFLKQWLLFIMVGIIWKTHYDVMLAPPIVILSQQC